MFGVHCISLVIILEIFERICNQSVAFPSVITLDMRGSCAICVCCIFLFITLYVCSRMCSVFVAFCW